MRKKKNGEARLAACASVLATRPDSPLSDSERDFHKSAPLWLEVGAGKGGFACEMTKRNPDVCFYAMEKISDCVVLAAERATREAEMRPDNLRFIIDGADNLPLWFTPGSFDTVFLNFSDPWPKKGYLKRRLTYRKYLAIYFTLLHDGGTLRFKTDNEGLFDFSLEEIAALGLSPDIVTRDLHHSEWNEGNVMTEYEKNFSEQGMNIHMLVVTKPAGFVPHYVDL